jgi:hypothetical protein
MSLSRIVVRILPQNNDLHLWDGASVRPRPDLVFRRIHGVWRPLSHKELTQLKANNMGEETTFSMMVPPHTEHGASAQSFDSKQRATGYYHTQSTVHQHNHLTASGVQQDIITHRARCISAIIRQQVVCNRILSHTAIKNSSKLMFSIQGPVTRWWNRIMCTQQLALLTALISRSLMTPEVLTMSSQCSHRTQRHARKYSLY